MSHSLPITPRTQVKRKHQRANYEAATIHAALDQALFGTVAFHDGVNTHAIPTAIWREGDYLYIHGSNGSRLIKFLQTGAQVCVSVTHIHGLVLARTANNHSMNYCSVVVYGAFEVVAADTKNAHLRCFLEHWMPGRWQYVRQPNDKELAATTVMRMPITEAVLKSRQGPPIDGEMDMQQAVWAGVIPLQLQWQPPQQAAEQNNADLPGKSVRFNKTI